MLIEIVYKSPSESPAHHNLILNSFVRVLHETELTVKCVRIAVGSIHHNVHSERA